MVSQSLLTTVISSSLTPVYPFPCEVDPSVFEVPQGYTMLGAGRTEPMRDEDDDLLQFAIQQSLLDAGTETDQVIGRGSSGLCWREGLDPLCLRRWNGNWRGLEGAS